MKRFYILPRIEILLFDEEEVLAISTKGYTAAMDANSQMETILGLDQKPGSITTVRLEDVNVRKKQ